MGGRHRKYSDLNIEVLRPRSLIIDNRNTNNDNNYRKSICLDRLAYFEKSLISNELKERKEIEDKKVKTESIWTKRRQLIILGQGWWPDEETENSVITSNNV